MNFKSASEYLKLVYSCTVPLLMWHSRREDIRRARDKCAGLLLAARKDRHLEALEIHKMHLVMLDRELMRRPS